MAVRAPFYVAVIFFNNLFFFKTMPRFRILEPNIGQGTKQFGAKNVVTRVKWPFLKIVQWVISLCYLSILFAKFIQAREDTIYNETTAGKKDTLLLSFMGQWMP